MNLHCYSTPSAAASARRLVAVASISMMLLTSMTTFARQQECHDKNRYLDLMQMAVEAYTPERIDNYISRTDSLGILEHGYARLTSNIGILIAHGRLTDMKPAFERMMDICVRELPVARTKNKGKGEIGNDFAVKEICCCLMELEAAGTYPESRIDGWKDALRDMKAEEIYSAQPKPGGKKASNVSIFGAASECARLCAGIGGSRDYADRYIADQLRFFDSNGMYKDPHQPMVYDFVTRLQFMAALNLGYDGPAKEAVEEMLLKSAEPTLLMQSVTGEIPYGGRSNQFLHNDTFMAAVCEYYATWMKQLGDDRTAARFKAAADRAVSDVLYWTSQDPVRHAKNRYPTETGYGCEPYAHFDKYMVTMGSWAYLAYRFADDSIEPSGKRRGKSTFVTTPAFHRIVMNAGKYTAQWDINAQQEYDADGLGRFQRAGAPPVIAISVPCPSLPKSKYKLDLENDGGLAISPRWAGYSVAEASKGYLELTDGSASWACSLSRKGLRMTLSGEGLQTLTLPAFEFDGETHSEIACDGNSLTITYKGWRCRYETNGTVIDTGKVYGNRNGHIRRFDASADSKLKVSVIIEPVQHR